MEVIRYLIDFILHIDVHLSEIITKYDTWTYLILFLIVFCETGLVITPFLPGDSLLFAAGTFVTMGVLNITVLILIIFLAAVLGDNSNYLIGKFIGHRVYEKNYKLIRREHLDKTQAFYKKYGAITVVLARFMPILRTFAPFVAGVGSMKYVKFFSFTILGNILWVNIFCWSGYFFANNEFVKNNFTMVVLAIIMFSLIPPTFTIIKQWKLAKNRKTSFILKQKNCE